MHDTIDGGPGADTVVYRGLVGIDVSLPDHHGGRGNENDRGVSIENVFGGKGDDVIIGDDRPNKLSGDRDNDQIFGNGGDGR